MADGDKAHTTDDKKAFDIEVVCSAFEKCIADKNAIDLELYIRAFHELLRFFHLMGAVFVFVAKDVDSKITILESYIKHDEYGVEYKTVQTMIAHEKSRNLLDDSKRPSGSRTLLRLHRALEFVSHFMAAVSHLEDNHSTVSVARDAYKRTLAKFHPWYIQKSALLAMYTLPYRGQLVERAFGGVVPDSHSDCKFVSENMSRLARLSEDVFNATQKLYDEHDLLDLP